MPRFCANISFLFRELGLEDRISAARDAGFQAVEILFPYDDNPRLLARELLRCDMPLALINAPPPNAAGGPRGFAAMPGREARFRSDFRRALRFAEVLRAQRIHIMAGEAEGEEARACFIENLRWAAEEAPRMPLSIEPINRHDMPGYFLADFDLAAEILDEVGAPNLGLQFDAYHAHRITGDTLATWARHGARAVHVQIAGDAGRHEPEGGAIPYPEFFARLDADGYAGWVSAEYNPAGLTADGLDWLEAARG